MDRNHVNIICYMICITLFSTATGVLVGKLIMEFSIHSLLCMIVEAILTTIFIIKLRLEISALNESYSALSDDCCKYKERTEQAEDWIENLVFIHFDDNGNIKDVDKLKKDIYWHAVHVGTKQDRK